MSLYGIYKKTGRKVSAKPLAILKSKTMRGAVNKFSRRYRGPATDIRVFKVKVRKKR